MKVQCRMFESTTKSWEALVEEASTFATSYGQRSPDQTFPCRRPESSDTFGFGAKGAIFCLVLGIH